MRETEQALPGGFRKDVVGYCDVISARPGQRVGFKLSALSQGHCSAKIVHLISGDDRPHGTGLIERDVAILGDQLEIPHQDIVQGSYARVEDMPAFAQGEIGLWVFPTLLDKAEQTVFACPGLSLHVSEIGFRLASTGQGLTLKMTPQTSRWYEVTVQFGSQLGLTVGQLPAGISEPSRQWMDSLDEPAQIESGDWIFAALHPGQGHFNGRLERPTLRVNTKIQAEWDFSQQVQTQQIMDVSGNAHHGILYQTPTRGVRGVSWDGSQQKFSLASGHYGAIHFHEDDITDVQWRDVLHWQVPGDLPSGQYALKLDFANKDGATSDEYLPFFVRPAVGKTTASVVYLVPTATYLAYANQRFGFVGGLFGEPKLHHANAAYLYTHEELGNSLYEYHRDGSGVHFSSRLRPVMNMKPKNITWAFNADTHITAWFDAIDQPFDVVTDEDLHLEGIEALAGYQVVVTGTHPEYYSTQMRAGLETFIGSGGRLMYMGGNGFYWRVAFQPDNPAIMEVRRAEDGTRAWIAQPGEYYHQFTGEYGGLWRRLGQAPNELVGVGFAAQGFDGGTHYRVAPGALDPRVGFIVDGVTDSDLWGNFGNQGGGAAGEEIDRWDPALGSPAHAVVLATSEGHKPGMLRVKEEFHMTAPLGNDAKVKADMTFFEVPGGGAVFSTGSISYAGSLAHNGYDNNIAQISANVLKRFIDPEPFEHPDVD